jgi:hypothetical protein
MPAGHADLFDSIYGDWREVLRSFELLPLGKHRRRPGIRLMGTSPGDKGPTRSRWRDQLSGPRDKSTVGNRTPALLTSSS